ncbi:hypothetical protein [Niallia taxi]|nr:hypothetical protein [Niallia taxi]
MKELKGEKYFLKGIDKETFIERSSHFLNACLTQKKVFIIGFTIPIDLL